MILFDIGNELVVGRKKQREFFI